ncbi:hypothetical protein GCM10027030_07610 [Luteococcus sediminum]
MHVIIISTYPPRQCGIATFSRDLRRGMLAADPAATVDLVASLQPDADPDQQREEVLATFWQAESGDYPAVAGKLNELGPDAVVIEHEYGIYGGPDGQDVVELASRLEVPLAVTLHTVLSEPSPHQREVLDALLDQARWILVFSPRAQQILTAARPELAPRIHVVPHGAPTELLPGEGVDSDEQRRVLREEMGLDTEGRTMLSTFGLLSPGKGLELAIRAMPTIVERHPEVLYVIAGRTHPEIVRRHGEAYREELVALVEELGMGEHIAFADGYLSDEQLQSLLGCTQIFVTPYRGREQIVSGALTFALAAGCAVVATRYLYAEDMLAGGAGWLVDFDDPQAIARAVNVALDDPEKLAAARSAARAIGSEMAWPTVGRTVLDLLGDPDGQA